MCFEEKEREIFCSIFAAIFFCCESSSSGVTVVGSDAPSDYHVAARTTENPKTQAVTSVLLLSPMLATAMAAGLSATALTVKKKRGRPRKYAPDGSVNVLSPKPISSSAPSPVIDFSSLWRNGENPASWVGMGSLCSVGANFTPHIITVNTGEDVTMKWLHWPTRLLLVSTLTYEGRFEILSLTGSFMPSETGGMRNRSGGLSVSRKIVIGSFLLEISMSREARKQIESIVAAVPTNYRDGRPFCHPSVNQTTPASSFFHVDNWSAPDSRNKPAEINVTLPAQVEI
ncbi:hypothetical protein HAX54_020742 [Datura stramonium]|uniref:AT-hook motif nuclear-localized protein n=1 Tax=Datura stramonium TaxID=4076 RepID=A0ABS8RMV0_DATST|nr:hypothetical protein [Datura stramonium]